MLLTNRRAIWLILLAVLLLAAFFRFWRLGNLPPGLYHDEAYNGLDALSLSQGKSFPQFYEGWELYAEDVHDGQPVQETRFPVFFEGNYGREPLHVYLMAVAVSFFGTTAFAIRFVPAAAGVLAVLTTFIATRKLLAGHSKSGGGYLVPLLAALTLSILYPAVHFSRFGIRAMLFVPVETMAVACFWWAINRAENDPEIAVKRGTWILFLLSGFSLGLGLYTFAASRLLPLVWIIFVPLWFWQDRAAFHRYWRQIAAMAATAMLTALPLLLFFLRYPYYFIFRIAYVANKGKGTFAGNPWMTWFLNVGRVARGLLWQGETHLRHNLPGRPYLDPIQVILFLLGLADTLSRLVQPRMLFLIIWFGAMLLPSILSGDAPHFGRLSGAAAPVAILVALGAEMLYRKLSAALAGRIDKEKGRKAALSLVVLLFMASAMATAYDYFVRYSDYPDLASDFYLADWRLGQYANGFGVNTNVYLTPTQEELATILVSLADPDQLRNYNGQQGLIPAGIPGEKSIYLVRPEDSSSLEALRSYFPDGMVGSEQDEFVPFIVDADSARIRTDHAADITFENKLKLVGWTANWEEDRVLVTIAWQAMLPMEKDYTAFVHLTDSDAKLLGQRDRMPAGYPTSDWQKDEIVVDRFVIELPENLLWGEDIGLSTGFYYLPTMEAVGETVELGMVER